MCLEAGAMPKGWKTPSSRSLNKEDNDDQNLESNIKSNYTLSPKDLLALVKNLELEINSSEGNFVLKIVQSKNFINCTLMFFRYFARRE